MERSASDVTYRYLRQELVPGIGSEGQARLARAKVLVVGLGGLGSPAAYYLAAAGVGRLGLLDSDQVECSNLNRQILHSAERVGMEKAASAFETLSALNPSIELVPIVKRLDSAEAECILNGWDAVVDATDSFAAKFMLNDACCRLGMPLASAGVLELGGQAILVLPGVGPCLRCLFPEIPPDHPSPRGILGAVAGIFGSLQAMEVIRLIVGLRDGRVGELHRLDGKSMRLSTLRVERRKGCMCEQVKR